MPKLKLTKRAVSQIRAPDPSGKQTLYWDSELKGFAVLASGTTNKKTYICQRTLGPRGKTRRLTVGPTNTLTIEQARDQAAEMLNDLRRRIDPKHKLKDQTVKQALDRYIAGRNENLRPTSIRVYRQIERTLAPWMDTPLREITGDMVVKRHRALAAEIDRDGTRWKGKFTANSAMRTLRIIYNFAADQLEAPDTLPPNPVKRLKDQWYPELKREGMVRSDDMARFYAAVQALKNPVARDYILILLFTGMRKTETATLRWDDIDFGERVIRVQAARAKSTRKLNLPMTDVVRNILVARRALGNTGYVFPGAGESGRLWDPGLSAVTKATGIKATAHWLRRGYITTAVSLDISSITLKVLVGHSIKGDVTAGYVVVETEQLREAAQKIADKIKARCGIEDVANTKVARL